MRNHIKKIKINKLRLNFGSKIKTRKFCLQVIEMLNLLSITILITCKIYTTIVNPKSINYLASRVACTFPIKTCYKDIGYNLYILNCLYQASRDFFFQFAFIDMKSVTQLTINKSHNRSSVVIFFPFWQTMTCFNFCWVDYNLSLIHI